jgi:hypothetical protein
MSAQRQSFQTVKALNESPPAKDNQLERTRFECHICHEKMQSNGLTKHMARMHNLRRLLKCPICEFETNQATKLGSHISDEHRNNSSKYFYFCPFTKAGFNSTQILQSYIARSENYYMCKDINIPVKIDPETRRPLKAFQLVKKEMKTKIYDW